MVSLHITSVQLHSVHAQAVPSGFGLKLYKMSVRELFINYQLQVRLMGNLLYICTYIYSEIPSVLFVALYNIQRRISINYLPLFLSIYPPRHFPFGFLSLFPFIF